MPNSGKGNGLSMGTDRGTGPATPESRAHLANEMNDLIKFPAFEPVEEGDAAATEIEATYRARLIGLRRLPRYQRAQARRAAREWRLLALRALREKRARERHANYVVWHRQLPAPRAPG
jgi:hypothetical protein